MTKITVCCKGKLFSTADVLSPIWFCMPFSLCTSIFIVETCFLENLTWCVQVNLSWWFWSSVSTTLLTAFLNYTSMQPLWAGYGNNVSMFVVWGFFNENAERKMDIIWTTAQQSATLLDRHTLRNEFKKAALRNPVMGSMEISKHVCFSAIRFLVLQTDKSQ